MTRNVRNSIAMAQIERDHYIDLAYRLVYCTEPEEARKLKEEIVRLIVLRRDAGDLRIVRAAAPREV